MTPKQWHRYIIDHASKIVAQTVLYGCFVECGVKQGTSSAIMAKNLDRNGYLFDTWHGPPSFSKVDAPTEGKAKRIKKRMNTKSVKKDCIKNLKGNKIRDKCTLIEGDICKTVPDFVETIEDNICMMHIDTDVSEPIKTTLECFWPYIAQGGVVLIHDYGDKRWRGVKIVVDEFVAQCQILENCNFYVFNPENLFAVAIVKGSNEPLFSFLKGAC